MKRPRKATRAPPVLSPAIVARAYARLFADYLAILEGRSDDDPKRAAQRIAAAGEVLDHIRLLADLAGGGAEPAQGEDEVLARAREVMADENET